MTSLTDLAFLDSDNLRDRVQMENVLVDLGVQREVIDWFFWRLDLARDEISPLRVRGLSRAPVSSVQMPLHQGLFHQESGTVSIYR